MYGFDRIRHYSSGSDGSDKDYGYAHDQEFLVAAKLRNTDECLRCRNKIYPTEKIDVGIQLHKKCFRCKQCDLTLTLNNFILSKTDDNGWKDVYCKGHAPKLTKSNLDPEAMGIKNAVNVQQQLNKHIRIQDQAGWQYDPRAMEFEHVKELGYRNKARRPATHDMAPDDIDYERGATIRKLREGELERDNVRELANSLGQQLTQNGHRLGHPKEPPPEKSRGRKFPTNSDYMEPNALWSPRAVEDPWNPHFIDPRQRGIQEEPIYAVGGRHFTDENPYGNLPNSRETTPAEQRNSTEGIYERLRPVKQAPDRPPRLPPRDLSQGDRMYHGNGERLYDYHNFEFGRSSIERDKANFRDAYPDVYRKETYQGIIGKGVRRKEYPNIRMANRELQTKPYFHEKAFIAQNELELRQRQEQFEMWNDIEKARESQIISIENDIRREMEKAVQELFMHMDAGMFDGDLEVEKMRIEDHFQRLKEERMRSLLSQLTSDERLRIDDMIDKQTQEMLHLIDKKVPTKLPSPKPPKRRKHQLYSGPQVFDDVDFVAVQVAQHEQASFTELVYELTRNCKSQLEKARAIFRWLAVKNLNQMMFSEDCSEDSPYYYLRGIKYGMESYHELFKRLCSYAGIPVKIIRGLSKSAGYKPGANISGSAFKNSWAVVYIEGDWRFVDCHWGARHVNNPRDVDEPTQFCYAMDEFYFLTDPDEMIFMHFPEDPSWQLLSRPHSMEEFVALPVVKSQFFQYHLKFVTQYESVITADTGMVELVLRKDDRIPLAFSTRLEQGEAEIDGYCIHHFSGKEVVFNLSLPSRGVFYFTVFACDTDKADSYNNVCSFRIKCTKVENKPFCKFPRMPDGYGPTPLATELGLSTEKYSEYYLVCQDDKMILNLKFKCPVKVSQKLVHGDDYNSKDKRELESAHDDKDPDRLVFQRYRDHSFVSYLIRFPKRGIYVFTIFAANRDSESSVLECACRYLIQCNAKCAGSVRPYPKTLQYWQRCRLHEPTTGDLKLNKNVRFKLEVPNASAVAVIVKEQWFYLKKQGDGNIFEGVAHTGKDQSSSVDVYCKRRDNDRDFFPLLEYKLLRGE